MYAYYDRVIFKPSGQPHPHYFDELRLFGYPRCCMIYGVADGALLTVMFLLHNACSSSPIDGHALDFQLPRTAGEIPLPVQSESELCRLCAPLTSISNHSSTLAYKIGGTFVFTSGFNGAVWNCGLLLQM
ncbi:hypothetical protein WMY93_025706 [Mugilogobius chulae]|uniref:Uncharacterized protein n=1 Tax=Mugilogobius chulae TaxID=88201 RepID=A0AAW0N793_9GOBI